ncbi:hypothetical protein AVEN_153937-1 [Araneus ventricosus]|uniref:Uncharacterized protein n=1 Tax=Araneus ventricosus TaxID=182803 RepID=A0A4Y2F946_ARAVE|nr:hypothetical protein AVEN_153937-1 [Araneus ventricosus]
MSRQRLPDGRVSALGLEKSKFETRFHHRSLVCIGLVCPKSYVEAQTSSHWCAEEVWKGDWLRRRHPHYLIAVQNDEIHPKAAFMLFQNETLN